MIVKKNIWLSSNPKYIYQELISYHIVEDKLTGQILFQMGFASSHPRGIVDEMFKLQEAERHEERKYFNEEIIKAISSDLIGGGN